MFLTGPELHRLRESLELSTSQLAQLLGVHQATVYRWEANDGPLHMEPLQASLVARLQQALEAKKGRDRDRWIGGLLSALLIGGTLVGLAYVLSELLSEDPGRRPKASSDRKGKGT
jgi:transcriptional regulator with XRE-family HTH domain